MNAASAAGAVRQAGDPTPVLILASWHDPDAAALAAAPAAAPTAH